MMSLLNSYELSINYAGIHRKQSKELLQNLLKTLDLCAIMHM